jgi:hypothetical protein
VCSAVFSFIQVKCLLFWSATPCASPPPWPTIFLIIIFLSATLLTRMTGISIHVQWPLTSQSNGNFLKENKWFVIMDQTPCPYQTRSRPAQYIQVTWFTLEWHEYLPSSL